ncbi:MAG: SpoIIE family protein phosphatase, partial [Candidatus Marinimicrobia bacterium]|nr:SpoIIE family protein phosphatase [Candidatus Neomarinimicrobiota bacterium]
YSEETVDLDAGDLLVLYSDGVTETFDSKENEFAEKNLTELLLNNLEHESKEIIENILDSLKEFSGDEHFDDDVTLLIVKRTT